MPKSSQGTPPLLVAAVWVFVALPLCWGLYQSVMKSKPLFAGTRAPVVQPVAAPGNK